MSDPLLDAETLNQRPEIATWKQLLLWIAVLPGSLLASMIVHAIAKALVWLSSSVSGDDSWWQMIFAQVVPEGIWAYAFVFCAAFIAPRAKVIVAIIFGAIVLALVVLAAIGLVRDHRWLDLVGDISGLVGAIIAVVSIVTGEQDVGQRTIYQPVRR
jgi:hypothetical protein